MRLLLLCLSLVCTGGYAQTPIKQTDYQKPATAVAAQRATSNADIDIKAEKMFFDTFYSPAFDLACSDELFIFDTDIGGFLGGSNAYFDVSKGQRIFTYPDQESSPLHITHVYAGLQLDSLAVISGLLNDVKLVAKVFRDPGNRALKADDFLFDSDSVRIGDMDLSDGSFRLVPFTFTPDELDDNVFRGLIFEVIESVIVFVDFINVYEVSDGTSGNIGLVSTGDGCGSGNNAFESFIDTTGVERFFTINENWSGLDTEFLIGVRIDPAPLTSTRQPVVDYRLTVSPNPVIDRVTLRFATHHGPSAARLFSVDGHLLRESPIVANAGTISWDMADLPAGVYLYQLTGSAGIQTGKLAVK